MTSSSANRPHSTGTSRARRAPLLFLTALSCLAAFALSTMSSARAAPSCDRFVQKRKQIHQKRTRLRNNVQDRREEMAAKLKKAFEELLSHAKKNRRDGQKEDLKNIIHTLERLGASSIPSLKKQLSALPAADSDSSGSDGFLNSWDDRYHRAVVDVLEQLRTLTNRAIKFRVNRFAHEFIQLILTLDPDNQQARNALGQRKFKGQWLNPLAYKMARKGVVWHDRYGWVIKDELERYKNGEYYDFQQQTWAKRAKLNEYHRAVNRPWTVRTEHLKIRANLRIQTVVDVANKLEAFYRKIFAVYSRFFTRGQSSYRLILGLKKHPPLKVRIFRNKEIFLNNVSKAPRWSAGLYSGRTKTSYFYGDTSSTMYHEFTHQIFDQFSPGGRGTRVPQWLEEGIATYSENPAFNRFGELEFAINRKVKLHLRNRQRDRHLSIPELMSINTPGEWDAAVEQGDNGKANPYAAAAALTFFCMKARKRRYRADLIDYLKDAHQGNTSCPLWNYMALSREKFLSQFRQWCQSQ